VEHTDPVIGYAFGLKNSALGLDLFGSPHELVQALAKQGISAKAAAQHIDTEITAQKVLKNPAQLSFSGGDDVPAFMRLLESLTTGDWAELEQLIAHTPSLIDPTSPRTGDLLCHLAGWTLRRFLNGWDAPSLALEVTLPQSATWRHLVASPSRTITYRK
jgi:hypothetical protein